MIAAAAAIATSGTIESWPSCARSAAAISAVSPGTGMPIVSMAMSTKSRGSPMVCATSTRLASTLRF